MFTSAKALQKLPIDAMMKRLFCVLLSVLMLPALALAENQKVFYEDETAPFPKDAELLTLYVCPIGGADCMLLTLGEHTMLVDTGRPTQAEQVQEMLHSLGLSEVEYVFSTHPHSDHIGGVIPLLDAGFGIGTFITMFPHEYVENINAYDYFGETLRALDRSNVPVLDLKTEDKIPFGDAELTVYRIPDEQIYEGLTCNEMSSVLLVRYGDCRVVLTADIEPTHPSQILLASLYDLKADIMKYPHHGMSLITRELLDNISPEFVFFTHGAGNTQQPQAQLYRNSIPRMVFATWGLITMKTDGSKWTVRQDIFPDYQEIADTYVFPQ